MVISTIAILILAAVLNFSSDMIPKVNDPDFMNETVTAIMLGFIPGIFGGGIFLSIFATAGITSDMLEKGNIDLLLSKPVSRMQLIAGKFLGNVLIVFANVAYAVIGIWLTASIIFNVWNFNFLLSIFTITYAFAVIYSLIMLITIMMRNSVLAMIISYLVFFILSPLLAARESIYPVIENNFLKGLIEVFYYITPQISELGKATVMIAGNLALDSYAPFAVSFLLMLLILTLSVIIFNKKDY